MNAAPPLTIVGQTGSRQRLWPYRNGPLERVSRMPGTRREGVLFPSNVECEDQESVTSVYEPDAPALIFILSGDSIKR